MFDKSGYKFQIDKENTIVLDLPNGVFVPTGTTSILIQAVKNYVKKPAKVLDLGSGSGAVGISLYKLGLVRAPLYISDLSKEAVHCANQNATLYNCPVIAKEGSLFEPWENEKFNYIVDDISGVAIEVAKLSPWFNNVPCNSGIDGTDLIVKVIQQASAHLQPDGLLFFPTISFSNVDKILAVANENFSHVKRLIHKEWFLPKEMKQHISTLKRMRKKGYIQFQEKFGSALWFTDIYVAYKN